MQRSVTADIPHPVLGKAVNQNTENLQVTRSPKTTATAIVQEVATALVKAIDGVVIMEVVPVESIVDETMMELIVTTT